MTIERVINHGIAYLRLTASLGLKKVGGRVVQRRKVVLSLGPMSRHDDGKPDYLRRLRESYNASDGDIVTLFKAFGIDVPAKIYTKGDLREVKSAIDPF